MLSGRIVGKMDTDGSYVIMQGDKELQRIPADEVNDHDRLARAIRRNGWQKLEE